MRPWNLMLTVSVVILSLWGGFASGEVPATINHQGYLTDGAGIPVNSTVGITFSIYSSNPARNNPVWRETQPTVAVSRGIYSALLGSTVPITAPFDVQYFLGIQVGNDPEMTPLQILTSVPYALQAKMAETVIGNSIGTQAIADNSITTSKIADSAVTDIKLADSSVTTAKLADGSVTDTKITGPVNDTKLSANISRLDTAETFTGAKTFAAPIASTVTTGTAPLQVVSTTIVPNLNAEMIGGKKLTDLDNRYPGARTVDPTLQQIATMRWYEVSQLHVVTVPASPAGMTFDGTHIWVVSTASDKVTQIRASDGAVVRTIELPTGSLPYAAAFDGQNVWVTNTGTNNVSRINVATGEKQEFPVGNAPKGIAFDGTNICVVNSGGNSVIKLGADGIMVPGGMYGVLAAPSAIVFDGSSMWVTSSTTNFISKISSSGSVTNLDAYPSDSAAFDGASVWTAVNTGPSLVKFSVSDNAMSTITIGSQANGIFFDGASIWYSGSNGVYKMRIDGTSTGRYPLSAITTNLSFDGANLWAAITTENKVIKIPQVAVTTPALTVASSSIEDGAVTTSKIASGAVSTEKIANSAITNIKIGTFAVSSANIVPNAVTSDKIATDAVNSAHIQTNAVTTAEIADGTIYAADIANNAINSNHIWDSTITAADLAPNAVTSAKIAVNTITSSHIVDGTIAAADIANSAVNTNHIVDAVVTSAKIAPDAVGMRELTLPASSATSSATLISGNNWLYPKSFTPTVNGQCLVIASSQIASGSTNPSTGPQFAVAYKSGGSDTISGDYSNFPNLSSGTQSAGLSRSTVISVIGGTAYQFGCYLYTTDGNWIGDTAYCNASYLCF